MSAAAMGDEKKTVIITMVNSAWMAPGSMMDLFMESLKIGNGTRELLNHLVVVAMDEKGYVRCMEMHGHCFALTTEGVDFSEQKNYMTADYLKLTWRRIEFLGTVLELGFSYILTVCLHAFVYLFINFYESFWFYVFWIILSCCELMILFLRCLVCKNKNWSAVCVFIFHYMLLFMVYLCFCVLIYLFIVENLRGWSYSGKI